jgi:hypothetical protein
MAQATVLEEPTLKPSPGEDETPAAGAQRNDTDFWKVKGAPPRQDSKVAEPKKKKGAGFFLAMILAFAGAGGAYYYLKTYVLPSGKPTSAPPVAPGAALPGPLESSVPASARPSGNAASSPTTFSTPPANVAADTAAPSVPQNVPESAAGTAAPVDTVQNFASIKVVEARLDDISKQVATLAEDIKTLIAGHAQNKEQLTQLMERARPAPAPVVAAARPVQPIYQVARAAAPKPVPRPPFNAAGSATNVVSVDMWNGTPSVAISEGDNIRFMSPGDVTAHGVTVKNADPVSQQVTFSMPSGEEVTARVDARK